jgi:hypothetical protein
VFIGFFLLLATAPGSESESIEWVCCPVCGVHLGERRGEMVLIRHAGREWLGRPEAMTCSNRRCPGVWRPLQVVG